ncbi:site-specific tyrosine recombinase XerC [Gemmata obscuriglobus]|uniref:Site-specific integrase n=1 Tax=Gemmata obscuriglobus TaxID=114 RepID=A0A2Z3GY95_9BACT|nr:site-specific integrase [Gemmata obscuriglobus]AWM38733.1 hypothetical protein C1280_18210 [Gemmata obscuriglobus]QEG28297.1 site-specific tyrosine recombinase XerC [Gemmata obscuriglobus]VTS06129.1 phage integrase : Phage integrase family OS=Rubrobacter radiotolerans GN=RradSPS_2020 PE=4 SV=1: Phage_int_SAM_3: Phage_integrase [Gemmata obscuriglobus UQM 2246]VTS08161.1 Phage integrase family OS=Rubrobacter radiotolerans GN=RradSPS_2020 PE=4 SV=1: Phage_int_SAM_3: Phage_integrase [Gemmata obs
MPKGQKRGNGEGGITKKPNGKYLARKAKQVGNELLRSSKTFDTRKDAQDWLKGQDQPAAAGTIGEWLDAWMEMRKPDISNKTYSHDKWRVDTHLKPRIGSTRLRDLTREKIVLMLAQMATDGQSDSERQKAGAVLRNALGSAVAFSRIPVNPMAELKLPNPKRDEKRAMLPDQCVAFLTAAESLHQLGYAFRLWLDAGLRPAEMFALCWDDFHPDKSEIKVSGAQDGVTNERKDTKTGKVRTIELAPSTVAAMLAARPPLWTGKLVMPDSRGGAWWQSNFLRSPFGPIRKKADLEWVTPYTMRHTMATLLLRAHVPLKVVSERLGHADVMTTLKHYAHVMPGDQQRAAAVMEGFLNPPVKP